MPGLVPGMIGNIAEPPAASGQQPRGPIMKTKHEIKMNFGEGRPAMGGSIHAITVPAGTRVMHADHGEYFVDDLTWLDRNSMAYHDATHYGIRLSADQVEE